MEQIMNDIQQDINYFTAIGFVELAKKFQRDLDAIKSLLNKS